MTRKRVSGDITNGNSMHHGDAWIREAISQPNNRKEMVDNGKHGSNDLP